MTGGLLALASFAALALVVSEGRRTRRLNRCLHELRRPLQALTLTRGAKETAERRAALADQVAAALRDLDAAVNRAPVRPLFRPVRLEAVTAALARRWAHADVRVLAPATDATVLADPRRLGAAVDNLVANGLVHGTGTVEVVASAADGAATIEVRDGGPSRRGAEETRDPRHGHGLRVAAETAAGSGGRLIGPRASANGTVAAIALPGGRERSG